MPVHDTTGHNAPIRARIQSVLQHLPLGVASAQPFLTPRTQLTWGNRNDNKHAPQTPPSPRTRNEKGNKAAATPATKQHELSVLVHAIEHRTPALATPSTEPLPSPHARSKWWCTRVVLSFRVRQALDQRALLLLYLLQAPQLHLETRELCFSFLHQCAKLGLAPPSAFLLHLQQVLLTNGLHKRVGGVRLRGGPCAWSVEPKRIPSARTRSLALSMDAA